MYGIGCPKSSFFSLRLPVDVLRDALFQNAKPVWPPADLDQFKVRVEVLPLERRGAGLDPKPPRS